MLLTKETAHRFLENPSDHNAFLICTTITDEAAELIASHGRGRLDLGQIKELSPSAASKLGAFKGELLLDGLKDPSPEVLAQLAAGSSRPPKDLSLKGITHIDQHQAKALSAFRGELSLRGLVEVTESCAKILGCGSCHHLYLDGIQTITAGALRNLLRYRSVVSLNGLDTLPHIEDSWEDLDGNITELYMDGLKSVTYESLKKLSIVPLDFFSLNGLESLPQRDEFLFEDCGAPLILEGIKKLTDIDLRIFGMNRPSQGLVLDGLEELDARQAEQLVGTDRDTLSIGIRKMSDEVAAVLLRSQSYCFIMNRLEELTPFAAEICGRFIHAHDVFFRGIQQISDEAFELLLADYTSQREDWCPGSFCLDGLKDLTPKMKEALGRTPHEVSLRGCAD